jgi:hypothetical protein
MCMPIQLLIPIVLMIFFKINIKPIPLVDQLNAVLRCEMTLTFYQSSLMESTLLDQIDWRQTL